MWRSWPWITIVAAVALAVSPLGLAFLHGAFFAGEQLTRNIAQPFVWMAVAILTTVGALEWAVKYVLRRRRQKAQRPPLD